jgi:6,7-dimethyl-8-ribityllumazine synthase
MSTASPFGKAAPRLDGRALRIGVAAARFNAAITDRLLDGALRGLKAAGVPDASVVVVRVPGAVELAYAAQALFRGSPTLGKPVDGVVALGCVLRGETAHFDYVCGMAADGLLRAMSDSGKPVAFGVLTCDHEAQALARAGSGDDNKGFEAAATVVECATLRPEGSS